MHIFRSTPVSPNTHNLYEYKWWSEKAKEIKFTVMLSPRTNRYRWTDFACVCVWVCDKTDDSVHTLSDWHKSVCLCVCGCMCMCVRDVSIAVLLPCWHCDFECWIQELWTCLTKNNIRAFQRRRKKWFGCSNYFWNKNLFLKIQ